MQQESHERTVFRQTEAQFLLRGVSGVTFGRNFTLIGNMVVGRQGSCDITIPNDGISRQHARIITRPGSILLEDLGSANGTYVNDEPIDKAIVMVGDEIRFDKVRFLLQSLKQIEELLTDPQRPPKNKPNRQTADADASISKKKIILGLLTTAAIAGLAYYFLNGFN